MAHEGFTIFSLNMVSSKFDVDRVRGVTMADPDLEIRRGGSGLQKNFFWPFGPQFGPRNKGGPGPPGPSPGSPPLY